MTDHAPDRRRLLQMLCALGLGAPLVDSRAQADSARAGPRLILGIPPGGAATKIATGFCDQYAERHRTRYRVEHVLGRDGRRSVQVARQAVADGNTLLMASSTLLSIFPSVYRELGYAPMTDIEPLAGICNYAFMFLVGSRVPAQIQTLDQYLQWVGDNPEYRHVGATLRGSQTWLMCQELAAQKDAPLQVVTYAGASPLISDMLGGNLAAAIVATGNGANARETGRVRTLAVSSARRWEDMPTVPTFAELGLKNMVMTAWYGLFAPNGMRDDVRQRLQTSIGDLLDSGKLDAIFKSVSALPLHWSPQEVKQNMSQDLQFYTNALKQARIEPL